MTVLGRQQRTQNALARINHVHRVTGLGQVVGKLAPNQARAHDQDAPALGVRRLGQLRPKGGVGVQIVYRQNMLRARQIQADGVGT